MARGPEGHFREVALWPRPATRPLTSRCPCGILGSTPCPRGRPMPRLVPLIQPVVSFALRQTIGEASVAVQAAVTGWFRDNTQLVPKALARAAERSWQAVGFAVGSDKLLARLAGIFRSGDEKAFRAQVREFLA